MTSQELQEHYDEIKKMYIEENISSSQIAKFFGVKRYQINYILEKNNIQKSQSEVRRRYYLNEHYFDKIDTPNKAYILGFLYADGYNNPINNTIVLSLSVKDEEILEQIRKEVGCEKPLFCLYDEHKCDNYKPREMRILTLASKYMSEKIQKWGLIPNKTFSLKFPTFLSKELMPHFIRGYFDGDGCVSVYKDSSNERIRILVSIMSSSNFCYEMQKFLESEDIFMCVHTAKGHNGNKLIRTGSVEEARKFMNYIYKDAELFVKRKREKFVSYFNDN